MYVNQFPAKPLDASKPVDKGSIGWNHDITQSLLKFALEAKSAGMIREAGRFSGWGTMGSCRFRYLIKVKLAHQVYDAIGKSLDDQYDILLGRNWYPTFFIGKIK